MKKLWQISILFIVSVLVLAACGSAQSDEGGGESGGAEGEAVKGGEIAIPIAADPTFNTWHPNAYAESNVVNRIIFTGLI